MVMGVDFGVIWAAEFDNIIRFEVRRPPPPAKGHPPPAVTPKFKGDDRYMIMGVELGFICAADFDNAIRYKVCRPARRQRVTRRPP